MGRVIAISNQKGGVGKTTTAINLSASIAVADKSVLLVDIDPQGNATSGLGFNREDLKLGIYEVMVGQNDITEAILKTEVSRLFVVPATMNLVGAELELVDLPERESMLARALKGIRNGFDYIFIDCPPSLGLLTLNALTASDSVIVPVQCEFYAMEGLGHLLKTLEMVQDAYNPQLQIDGIVLTMFDGRNSLSHQVLNEVRNHVRHPVYQNIVPRNVTLAEAPSHGRPVLLYDIGSRGAQVYLALAKEIIEHAKEGVR